MVLLAGTRQFGQKAPPGTISTGSGFTTPGLLGLSAFSAGGRLTRGGGEDTGGLTPEQIAALEELLAGGFGDGGGGGGGGGGAFGGTEAGARLAQQFALAQLDKEQSFLAEQAEKDRQERQAEALEKLKAERQRIFTDLLGTDPVRAVLFAMGIGGEILPGGERFANLPALKGAAQQGRQTEQALTGILGGDISIGQQGVTGLPDVVKAASAFSAGQGASGNVGDLGAARTLLTSGFGVGATRGKGRPGLSRQEVLRQIASVTPQGALGT